MSREILNLADYKAFANAKTEYTDNELNLEIDIANNETLDWIKFPDIETFEDKFPNALSILKKVVFNLVNLNIEINDGIKSQSLEGNSISFQSIGERKANIFRMLANYKAMYPIKSVLTD